MAGIIKTYAQTLPASRFIGKKFGDTDRVNGGFGKQWGDAFAGNWFGAIEAAAGGAENCAALYEDGGAYIGLMRWKEGEPFQYWVGMFAPAGTNAPGGFDYIDFPESGLGVAWIKGKESTGELYGKEPLCLEAMQRGGVSVTPRSDGVCWFFERYVCPRFAEADESGEVILDICFFR